MEKLKQVTTYFFGFWVLIAICLQTWGVFSRNILTASTAWIDDLQRMNFIWLIWILGALAYGTKGLIGLDIVQAGLLEHPRAFHAMTLLQGVFEIIFGAVFTYLAFGTLQLQLSSGEATTVLAIPLWLLNLGFFIGCAILTLYAARKIVRAARDTWVAAPTNSEAVVPREA